MAAECMSSPPPDILDESSWAPSPAAAAPPSPPEEDVGGSRGRVSMYVKLFDEMLRTVLESEPYLFTPRELWILRHIIGMQYEPLYLLTRLLLRRPRKVHPFANIVPAYSAELGEDGVKRAAEALCAPLEYPDDLQEEATGQGTAGGEAAVAAADPARPWAELPTGLSEDEERADPDLAEAIRVSLWSERTAGEGSGSGLSQTASTSGSMQATSSLAQVDPSPPPDTIEALAHDESGLSLDDIMSCIPADDLRRVARARKVPMNLLVSRESTMRALKDVARKQTTLGLAPLDRKGKGKANGAIKRTVSATTTSEHKVLAELLPYVDGHVVQIDPALFTLVARVNLIFSRAPPQSVSAPALMLPPILVTSNKRSYPDYGEPTRSVIWKDREELIAWERAVLREVLVSETLGDNWAEQRRGGGYGMQQPLSRADGAKLVRKLWEAIWPQWQEMVAGEGGHAPDAAEEHAHVAGDRFKTGHVLTRIVYKGAESLGILHEYDLECEVLRALLAQRRWRRGKRGAWYERLALVLMTHYNKGDKKTEKLEEATQVCIDALLDDDTHIIYRPGLSRRLTRLEKKLRLPPEECHISYAELQECLIRTVVAPRVQQNIGQARSQPAENGREREPSLGLDDEADKAKAAQQVGKSVWLGREGEVTVEGWVLEWWEDKGYQGFHAEGSILSTLFTLLMWPVLFHPLPGAFETRYQTAPLDLGEDTFARARRDLVDARLDAMQSNDAALAMLRDADSRERPRGTWAVGVNWDFGARELEEIVTCLGGRALSVICRMLSEEYRHRMSGVPDLIVWNIDEKEVRFVEVKGPGDQLSETQRVWIDVLQSVGVPVEVCRVQAKDGAEAADKLKRKNSRVKAEQRAATRKRGPSPIVVDDSSEGEAGEAGEADEWQFESGDEGKGEGHWERAGERAGKRAKK
ncbi:hypothetical protein Q8F55_005691 [Vanrija albida]|uniref:Fanconi-associated nuclease n=1 Tax=Vanrija albida TaxID=181172 RepID=A0ABR3Q356_9TREE